MTTSTRTRRAGLNPSTRAVTIQVPCPDTDNCHADLGLCKTPCSTCERGFAPRCPDCGAAV